MSSLYDCQVFTQVAAHTGHAIESEELAATAKALVSVGHFTNQTHPWQHIVASLIARFKS